MPTTDMQPEPLTQPRLVAVVDIGSTSVRMQIAEIQPDRTVRRIESFSQAVSLGDDTFIKRVIDHETIEDCVHVLSSYRDKLTEYGIDHRKDVRVVATSGLSEASNKLTFRDRIFVATGFDIEPFDEAELHRVTYLGVLPFLFEHPKKFSGQTLVLEVGGGTSEVLLLDKQDVQFARTFPMGALRLRKMIEAYDAPLIASRSLMEARISRTVAQLAEGSDPPRPNALIAMGGDVRFAAREISQQPGDGSLIQLNLKDVRAFTETILSMTPATIAARYHMSLPDALSLGPALLTQTMYASELGIKDIYVVDTNMRDGLIQEIARGNDWSAAVRDQMVKSGLRLGRKFCFDEDHARHVARLATSLFDQLVPLHRLSARQRSTLELAALLHDVGRFISVRSRHKHSMYLIQNSELFGISRRELGTVALVARYYRGANPSSRHAAYTRLDRDQRLLVSKLASILRLAKSLDVARRQRIDQIQARVLGNKLLIEVADVENLTVEQLELKQNGKLFESIFGKRLELAQKSDTVAI
jgi:exopolyphosphatase/guanosine-5'-triphosphate,3'-diphosphate pyrophosphatase